MTDKKKNVKEEKQRLSNEELDNVVGGRDDRPPFGDFGDKLEKEIQKTIQQTNH